MYVNCPYCGLECYGEAPHHIGYYCYECECGKEFSYYDYRSEYYDLNGNVIKPKPTQPDHYKSTHHRPDKPS